VKVCPNCGAEVTPKMKFCSECGTKLDQGQTTASYAPAFEEEGDESSPVVATDAASLIELDQVEGTAGRRMHDIGEETITVGRGPESDIFLDDVTVSRKHAEIERGEHGYRIRDVGSLNGTYVNRDRIDDVLLQGGDEVQIGKFRLVYFTGHSAVGR
jgi:pSer/pThr/pTyr-binding forkhead associated (FHA) protein